MIQNFIFDMGNVLLKYNPDIICQNTVTPEFRQLVKTYLLGGPEWKQMDQGILTEDTALKQIFAKIRGICYSEAFYKQACEEIQNCLTHWHEYLTPITEMGELVRELKAKGYKIYLCSNAALSFFTYCHQIPSLECFDGLLVSAKEKCLKPSPEIYSRLFKKFDLNPEECLFIDDLQENIDGAKWCGMDGYCFVDGDVEKLRSWVGDKIN